MQWYVRFRTNLRVPGTRTPLGVFRAAAEFFGSEVADPRSAKRAKQVCQWFDQHLPVPRLRLVERRAVFWFREECRDMIQRLWQLAVLLNEQGLFAELVRTRQPGRVCYVDEFQIAAIPWRVQR